MVSFLVVKKGHKVSQLLVMQYFLGFRGERIHLKGPYYDGK